MFMGYLTHLILDEIYSVDVLDTRIKASFGTAVKLYDTKRLWDSGVIAAATAIAFAFTPSSGTFVAGITSKDMWSSLQQKLLPHDHTWFGLIHVPEEPFRRAVIKLRADGSPIYAASAAAGPARESGLTTGSIKPAEPVLSPPQ